MPFDLTSALGVHEHTLAIRARRAAVLATNMANSDTPHYKARDLDFGAVLRSMQSSAEGRLATTRPGHIATGSGIAPVADLGYRVPLQASLDGNTVDSHHEQVAFSENAMHYMATLRFLNGRVSGLLTAIRGD